MNIKKVAKFFLKLIIVIILLGIIFKIFFFNDKYVIKSNCEINVPNPLTCKDIYNEQHPDSDIFYIYTFKENQKSKVSKDLTLISENNKNIVFIELEKYTNHILSYNKEKMTENFDNNLIRENNYYKVLYKDRRLRLVIFDVEKCQLYYFSTIVENGKDYYK